MKSALNNLLNVAELAERYYNIVKPGKYDRHAASKQFRQDNHLDKKGLRACIREITKEALQETESL